MKRIDHIEALARITERMPRYAPSLGKRRAKGTNSLFISESMIYDIDNDKVY